MERPNNLITTERAIELSSNFKNKNKLISLEIGKPNNCSVWYSLEELETYMAYIKDEAKLKGYTIDGIRFYLGSYSEKEMDSKKQNQTTLFLSPTGSKLGQGKEHTDAQNTTSSDITDIGPLNFGQDGTPPNSAYPTI